MKSFLLILTVILGNYASATDLGCEFTAPNVDEMVGIQLKPGMWTFEKTYGDFQYSIDMDESTIIAIQIKDLAQKVTAGTIATTGGGIFAKPRQLSLISNGRHAEVNCW